VSTCVLRAAAAQGDRAYPSGVVTLRELQEELPFPTKMVVVSLPGRVLQEALWFSRTSGGAERRGFLQVGTQLRHLVSATLRINRGSCA